MGPARVALARAASLRGRLRPAAPPPAALPGSASGSQPGNAAPLSGGAVTPVCRRGWPQRRSPGGTRGQPRSGPGAHCRAAPPAPVSRRHLAAAAARRCPAGGAPGGGSAPSGCPESSGCSSVVAVSARLCLSCFLVLRQTPRYLVPNARGELSGCY